MSSPSPLEEPPLEEQTFLQRMRTSYISWGPICWYTWYFTVIGVSVVWLQTHCLALLVRLVLHSCIAISILLAVLCSVGSHRLYQNVTKNHPIQKGRVLKTKTIPEVPHPCITQRILAWIRLLNDHENVEEQVEALEDSETDTPPNAPMVLLAPEDCVQVGDVLTLSLMDGDPIKLLYLPYQRQQARRMLWKAAKAVATVVAAFLILYFCFPGLSVVAASASDMETYFQSSWYCTWMLDEDEEQEEIDKDLARCCSIPSSVTWAYYLVLYGQLIFLMLVVGRIWWKVRNVAVSGYQMLPVRNDGSDEPTAPFQQLDSNDDGEDVLQQQQREKEEKFCNK